MFGRAPRRGRYDTNTQEGEMKKLRDRKLSSKLPSIMVVLLTMSSLVIVTNPIHRASAQVSTVELQGVFHIIWGTIGLGEEPPSQSEQFFLVSPNGTTSTLMIDEEDITELGGITQFNNDNVVAQGTIEPDTGALDVESMQVIDIGANVQPNFALQSGPKPWISILCRFADAIGVTPQPLTYFNGLMSRMDQFYRETSYQNINLAGSMEVGWVNLPKSRASYLAAGLGPLASDCVSAADPLVSPHFPDFFGINLMFNQDIGCCSWGGGTTLTLDGVTKNYATTWMATWGWGNMAVMQHEMGHGFGLPHSSGPYGATYDSDWSPMSNAWACIGRDPTYGCVSPGYISFEKDALGWIPPSRRYVATTAPDQLVFIERLSNPNPAGYLEAKIPIGGSSTRFYTVETRKFDGFDVNLPGQGVIIHNVDLSRGDRLAQVVDVDPVPDTDPNDAGAIWLPGQHNLFQDPVNNISVLVLREEPDGFWVIINPTLQVSKSFTDEATGAILPSDNFGNPQVDVTLDDCNVVSTSPQDVIVQIGITNAGSSPIQSLKLADTLPVDWSGEVQGVFFQFTDGTQVDLTGEVSTTTSTGNPQTVTITIDDLTTTSAGKTLDPGEMILVSVKIAYNLMGTCLDISSFPINYVDTATASGFTGPSFTGTEFDSSTSAFFTAYAMDVS